MEEVNIISFNVNGLGKKLKRNTIFDSIKKRKQTVFLLQETFSKSEIEEEWQQELNTGRTIFCHGSNRSRGVLIYLPNQ